LPLELVESEVTSITYEFNSKTFKKQTEKSITQEKNFSPELASSSKAIK
jgi:hypothetical protein